jgi:5-methylcytosine-specific restriction enzyme A
MPRRSPQHRPVGWQPAPKRNDPVHRRYHTQAWQQTRRAVIARDAGLCTLCGGPGNTVDHIREVRDGGTDALSNLRLICAACHNRRHPDKGTADRHWPSPGGI